MSVRFITEKLGSLCAQLQDFPDNAVIVVLVAIVGTGLITRARHQL